jgi:hypothetical protein
VELLGALGIGIVVLLALLADAVADNVNAELAGEGYQPTANGTEFIVIFLIFVALAGGAMALLTL